MNPNETKENNLPDAFSVLSGLNIGTELTEKISKEVQATDKKEVTVNDNANPESGKTTEVSKTEPVKTEVSKTEVTTTETVKDEKLKDIFNVGEEKFVQAVEIKDLDSLIKEFNSKTSIDIKDLNDFNKVLNRYEELSKKEKVLEETETKKNMYESIFTDLPDDLFVSVDMFLKGEDYKSYLKNTVDAKLDYKVSFDKQPVEKVLDVYFPGEFTKEEIDEFKEGEENKAIKLALRSAKERYSNDQKVVVESKDKYLEKQDLQIKEYEKRMKDSANNSFEVFKSNSDFGNKAKQNVKTILDSGAEALNSILFENDGTWKKDAAEKVAYLLYGKDIADYTKEVVRKRTETKINEDLITRGNTQPPTSVSSSATKSLEEERIKQIARELIPGAGTNPFINK